MPFRWIAPLHTKPYTEVAREHYNAGYKDGLKDRPGEPCENTTPTIPPLARVLLDVEDECGQQVQQWGEQSHPDGTASRWSREAADKQRERTQYAAQNGELTWKHILLEEVYEALAEGAEAGLREELVQVAAVCASWIKDLDTR